MIRDRRHTVRLFTLLLSILFSVASSQTKQNPPRGWLTVETIMRDPAWMGISPGAPYWSEDGERIYFTWRSGEDKGDSLYVVDAEGGVPKRVAMVERRKLPSRFGSYTKNWKRKVYSREGDIFLLDVGTNKETQLTSTSTIESSPRFTFDERKIVFEREGNLFARDLTSGTETQLTNFRVGQTPKDAAKTELQKYLEKEDMELFEVLRKRKGEREDQKKFQEGMELKKPKVYSLGTKSVSGFVLSPDEKFISFILTQTSTEAKRTVVPNYVTESGFTEDITGRTKVGEPQSTYDFYVYNIALDSAQQVKPDDIPGVMQKKAAGDTSKTKPRPVVWNGPHWSEDGTHAFVQAYSQDNKDRWIVLLDAEKAKFTTLLEHQHDDAWVGGPGIHPFGVNPSVGWLPDSKRIFFQSEEDGYSHLYTVSIEGKNKTQLTKGKFEIYSPQISKDKKGWFFSSNETHYGEVHFYSMPMEGGARTRTTSMEGRNDAILSPDENRIAFLYSYSNKPPDLYVVKNKPESKPTRLTDSPSSEFKSYEWRAPEILTFKARDGADVPARLYKPERPNGAAVIFVHGAGYLQNAHKWWSSYFREYMFNNLLADKGYTVLDVDYRASAGLGRDWRTAIYRHMGGKDLDDQVDGAGWLVQQQEVDPKRIGLYGGSYGGFITLMAMFTQPDVFAAGAALRSVTDWAHYNHGYASNILNVPQEDSIAYRQSSPIYFAEGLRGALLLCHGMVDVNVHFQDDVRLVQRLIELKKENWEFAVYPVEDHGFVEPTSWTDEYRRILKLFETNLQKR